MADFAVAKNSFRALSFTVSSIPSGLTISLARFVLKEALSDADADALINKEITTVNLTDGYISDTGASGTGIIKVYIQERDLRESETDFPYEYALKLKLSDNEWYMLDGLKGLFLALEAGIEAPVFELEAGSGEFTTEGKSVIFS